MTDPFDSSRRKLARAEEHFGDLQGEIEDFNEKQPYERIVEPHPDKPGHTIEKVRMTHEIPASIADRVSCPMGPCCVSTSSQS